MATTLSKITPNDPYLDLVQLFPLRPIRTRAAHEEAKTVLRKLIGKRGTSVRDYKQVLASLIAEYGRPDCPASACRAGNERQYPRKTAGYFTEFAQRHDQFQTRLEQAGDRTHFGCLRPATNTVSALARFVIRTFNHSSLIRHSNFVIRHCPMCLRGWETFDSDDRFFDSRGRKPRSAPRIARKTGASAPGYQGLHPMHFPQLCGATAKRGSCNNFHTFPLLSFPSTAPISKIDRLCQPM